MADPSEKPIGLVPKLCQVMMAVDHVEKLGRNRDQNYNFARDVDVSNALRKELASRLIFFRSSINRVDTEIYETKSGGRGAISTVYTDHAFIDGETGEQLTFTWASQGMDGQDKGVSKGATSAIKYALLKQFLIPTGEDPDENKVSTKDYPAKRTAQPLHQPPPPPGGHWKGSPHRLKTPNTTDDVGRKWFWATMRDQFNMNEEQVKKLLSIDSFREQMGTNTFEQIFEAVIRAIPPAWAQDHERS